MEGRTCRRGNWIYVAEEISKQRIEGVVWLLLIACSKMKEVRNALKTELLSQKEAELKDVENFQLIHVVKMKLLREWLTDLSSEEVSMGQPFLQNPGAVLQDNGRMTLRQFRDTQGPPFP